MKKIDTLFVAFLLFCSSCESWLTVEPKNMETADKMFSSELGFSTALIGLYQGLVSIYAPTGFMMGGSLEYVANNYIAPSNTDNNYDLYIHRYSGNSAIDTQLGAVFTSYYRVIANANTLLNGLNGQTVLSEDMARMVEGEALAIRAFCHFELLRMWGPVPTQVNATQTYLPYVTTLSTDLYEYHTYEQYMSFILADFNRAVELLETVDPIVKYPNSSLNTSSTTVSEYGDSFWYFRQKRFNVYGVKALLARLYLWKGDTATAYNLAKEVVELKNTDGTSKFSLGTSSDVSTYSHDLLFFKEHLVGLDIANFRDSQGAFSGRFAACVNDGDVINNTLYEGETDLRKNLFVTSFSYSYGRTVYGTTKYLYMTDTDYFSTSTPKSIPLIRLSELYFILMETAPLDEANRYYETFRGARSASYTPLTENNRIMEVMKEYVREFFSEEQSFFVHKRLNMPSLFLSGASINSAGYIFPIPSEEFGTN